jgi:hypothetical protein
VLVALTVVGTLASLIGVYALVENRRNRRIKLLGYEPTGSLPLATASSVEQDYKLSIHYKPPGEDEELIEAAFVRYLRFANFGREPIRREDIAPANRLRVEAEGGRILDISLVSPGREVTRVGLGPPGIENDRGSADLTFDYLDEKDGAVVKVLSTEAKCEVRLVGDVIGMPGGIVRTDKREARGLWGKVGFGLWVVAEISLFAAAAYVVEVETHDWANAWLLVLPLVAFVTPFAVAIGLSELWPSRERRYPDHLALPGWFGRPSGLVIGSGPAVYPDMWYFPPDDPAEKEKNESSEAKA